MNAHLFDASVPVFRRYLRQMAQMLLRLLAFAEATGQDPNDLLAARLAPDMLPCAKQIEIAANFVLRAAFPLAGQPVPDLGEFEATVDGLQHRLQYVMRWLDTLDSRAPDFALPRLIEDRAGRATVRLSNADFLHLYALPNFFFHATAAYAILRAEGVPLSKGDFDGFHVYADPS